MSLGKVGFAVGALVYDEDWHSGVYSSRRYLSSIPGDPLRKSSGLVSALWSGSSAVSN